MTDLSPRQDARRAPSKPARQRHGGQKTPDLSMLRRSGTDPRRDEESHDAAPAIARTAAQRRGEQNSGERALSARKQAPEATYFLHCARDATATRLRDDEWAPRPSGELRKLLAREADVLFGQRRC